MKRFIALFVVLGAALMAAPGIIGFQVEKYYQGLMQQFAKGGVELVSQDYQRAWFGAESRTGFLVRIPGGADRSKTETLNFSLVSHIVHGPLTTEGVRLADIQSDIRVEGESLLPADYEAVIRTLIEIDGQGSTRIDLPASEIPASGQRPSIRFSGVEGEMRFDAAFEQVDARFTLPTLRLAQQSGQLLEIDGMQFDSHSRRDISGLMLGGGRFEIGRIGLRDEESGSRFEIRQLGIDAQSNASETAVSASVRYRLEELAVNETAYGPADIQLGVGNLSPKALLQVQQSIDEINAQQLSDEKKGMALLSVLMGNAPALLKGDPVVTIDKLSIQTPDGLITGKLSVQSVGLELKEIGNAPAVLNKLVADASLQMPKRLFMLLVQQKVEADLLRQFEQRRLIEPESEMPDTEQLKEMAATLADRQLSLLLGQEILLAQGDMIATQATLSGGLLSVNGKTIPLPQPPQ
ncbi:YdgA family protein [Sedimenticola selenatireducens]|nr:YdgA family protein [Sedimenticola selenatireducens]